MRGGCVSVAQLTNALLLCLFIWLADEENMAEERDHLRRVEERIRREPRLAGYLDPPDSEESGVATDLSELEKLEYATVDRDAVMRATAETHRRKSVVMLSEIQSSQTHLRQILIASKTFPLVYLQISLRILNPLTKKKLLNTIE